LKKLVGPLRRALIYGLISYSGLVLINNSELALPNMWIAYLPMFIGALRMALEKISRIREHPWTYPN